MSFAQHHYKPAFPTNEFFCRVNILVNEKGGHLLQPAEMLSWALTNLGKGIEDDASTVFETLGLSADNASALNEVFDGLAKHNSTPLRKEIEEARLAEQGYISISKFSTLGQSVDDHLKLYKGQLIFAYEKLVEAFKKIEFPNLEPIEMFKDLLESASAEPERQYGKLRAHDTFKLMVEGRILSETAESLFLIFEQNMSGIIEQAARECGITPKKNLPDRP